MSAAYHLPEAIHDGVERESWLAARRGGIGSSDAPGILGISPFASPFDIAIQKLEKAPPTDRFSELMAWGNRVEAPMLEQFLEEMQFGGEPLEGHLTRKLFRCTVPDHNFMLATPDAEIMDGSSRGGAECKLKIFQSHEWEQNGIPDHVMAQVQHQMFVMSWEFVYVLVLLDGYRLRWKRVEPNPEVVEGVLIPAERKFWDDIMNDNPIDPSLGAPKPTYEALRHLYPTDNGETTRLEGIKWLKRVTKWKHASKQERIWKKIREQQRNALIAGIGHNTYGQLDDGSRLSLGTVEATVVAESVRSAHRKLHQMKESS